MTLSISITKPPSSDHSFRLLLRDVDFDAFPNKTENLMDAAIYLAVETNTMSILPIAHL